MRIAVLGPLHFVDDDLREIVVAGNKARLLLAVLAAAVPNAVSVDRLVDTLWRGHEPPTARKSLQAHVVRLRSALEPGRPSGSTGRYVLRRGDGYVLAVTADELDVLVFPGLVARGRALLSGGDATAARELLAEALALWRGDPYQDWSGEQFAEAERRRLSEIRAGAEEALLDADLALGRPGQVVASATCALPSARSVRASVVQTYGARNRTNGGRGRRAASARRDAHRRFERGGRCRRTVAPVAAGSAAGQLL